MLASCSARDGGQWPASKRIGIELNFAREI
jgi:hypothetical protein